MELMDLMGLTDVTIYYVHITLTRTSTGTRPLSWVKWYSKCINKILKRKTMCNNCWDSTHRIVNIQYWLIGWAIHSLVKVVGKVYTRWESGKIYIYK